VSGKICVKKRGPSKKKKGAINKERGQLTIKKANEVRKGVTKWAHECEGEVQFYWAEESGVKGKRIEKKGIEGTTTKKHRK